MVVVEQGGPQIGGQRRPQVATEGWRGEIGDVIGEGLGLAERDHPFGQPVTERVGQRGPQRGGAKVD